MKKFLFVLLVILVIGGVAFAGKGNMRSTGSRWETSQNGRGYGRSVATEEQQNQYGKGNGNGYQNQDQTCDEFVDEDGDGVCDNCEGEGLAPQDGTGNQYGRNGTDRTVQGRGNGYQAKGNNCVEFVDEDGDGVCDNCEGEGLGTRRDRVVDTGNFNHKFLGSFNETPEITEPVPSQFGNQYGKGMNGRFSRQGGRGNSRNCRK